MPNPSAEVWLSQSCCMQVPSTYRILSELSNTDWQPDPLHVASSMLCVQGSGRRGQPSCGGGIHGSPIL